MANEYILEMENITKAFFGAKALDGVSFNLREGEIHALCGENGAGKSTLMKILAGNYLNDEGEIFIDGERVEIRHPLDAEKLGIAIVYQELSLSPTVSIAENIFMGREPVTKARLVDKKAMNKAAKEFLDIVKLDEKPELLVRLLSVAKMQLVQIAKALSMNAKILIMDEPCSSLGEEDSNNLFEILEELKERGIGIVYIDHRMENIFRISDRVTVLRDGCSVDTKATKGLTRDDIIQMMVGRSISNQFPKTSTPQDDFVFEIKELNNYKLKDIGFSVKKGEVFGLAGLVGAGRSEIMRAIFGIDKKQPGAQIRVHGNNVKVKKPQHAIRAGIGYVPEDRKLEGLVLFRSVIFNTVLVFLKKFCKGIFVSDKRATAETKRYVNELNIKVNEINGNVAQLSGGNQQKVVLAKWLLMDDMKVLMLDEPTRGIDVGAKFEIYKLIDQLAQEGIAVIIITSEMSELIGLCDRIAVIADGEVRGVLERSEFSQEAIMKYCV